MNMAKRGVVEACLLCRKYCGETPRAFLDVCAQNAIYGRIPRRFSSFRLVPIKISLSWTTILVTLGFHVVPRAQAPLTNPSPFGLV